MKRCALLLLLLLSSCGRAPESPAGIVLYSVVEGEVLLLLADHRLPGRGWAAYGGAARAGETSAETAARETEEETRGYFKRADLLKDVEGGSKEAQPGSGTRIRE